MLTMLICDQPSHPNCCNCVALHCFACSNTQLTSSHPAPPPFLWPLRSRGLSSNHEGRMYYVPACDRVTKYDPGEHAQHASRVEERRVG